MMIVFWFIVIFYIGNRKKRMIWDSKVWIKFIFIFIMNILILYGNWL